MAIAKTPEMRSDPYPDAESGAAGHGVHPLVIQAAVVASVWFLIAMAISFSGTIEANYLLIVVIGFGVIFFTLVLGLAGHAAARTGGGRPRSLDEFLSEDVAIDSGSISGREAMIQVLTLPVTLAVGATIIGFIFVLSG